MTPEFWKRVEDAFDQALNLDAQARSNWLQILASRDAALADQVQRLLNADSQDDDSLQRPIQASLNALAGEFDDPWLGRQLGPYRIIARVATGGMGAVFRAERSDAQYEQCVAVKLMGSHLIDADARARFRTERQILARMQHPYIARMFDGGELEDNSPYLVMEYVTGMPITEYCTHQALHVEQRLRLFLKVCHAVAYAHRNLVVHRDIKPSNILVDEQGDPKLLDFGIAKLLGDSPDNATVTVQRMTPDYASPEQITGQPITTVSDVYALGVLLYEMLSGQRPFQLNGLRPAEMEHVVCDTSPTRPSDVATATTGNLPRDLDAVVLKAMHRDPEQRYSSVQALSEDIQRHLRGLPVDARGQQWRYIASKFVRRHALAAASTAMATLLAGGALLYHNHSITSERDQARFEADRAKAVTAFLIDIFKQSNPDETDGATVTAREILDTGAQRLQQGLSEQPRIRAELHHSIGMVYSYLGQYDQALPQFAQVSTLGAKLNAPRLQARGLAGQGRIQFETGQLQDAQASHQQALHLLRTNMPGNSPQIAYVLNDLAEAQFAQGDYARADANNREALDILTRTPATGRDYLSKAQHDLGVSLQIQGQFDEAEHLLRQALDNALQHFGERNSNTLAYMHALAALLHERGHNQEAEKIYLRVLALEKDLLGEDYIDADATMTNLGRLYSDMEQFEQAERFLRAAVAHVHRVRGPDHAYTAYDMINLANLLHQLQRPQEAYDLAAHALEIYSRALPDDHPYIASASLTYAGTLIELGRPGLAEQAARRALEICQQALPAGHWLAASARSVLGEALFKQNQADAAEPLLVEAYPVLAEARPGDRATANALRRLIHYYQQTGNDERAAHYLAQREGES